MFSIGQYLQVSVINNDFLKRDIKPSETTMKLPHMKTPRLRA
jgi:hypothetical protein